MQPSDTNIRSLLGFAGLTLNEADVYEYLLRSGMTAGADLYKDLGMDKSSCYRALSSLIDKNLAYKVGEERNLQFAANPPETVLSEFDRRQGELVHAKQSFGKLIENIENVTRSEYARRNITILRGLEGFQQWNLTRLAPGTRLIREVSSRILLEPLFASAEAYDAYMAEYIRKRKARSVRMQLLINPETQTDYIDVTAAKDLKETRILPKTFALDATVSTFGESTGFISEKKGDVLSIIIKDAFISHTIAQMIDVLWAMSTPKPESGTETL